MCKRVCILLTSIFLLLNVSILSDSSGIYRYVMGEKEEMLIDYNYVVVDIENEELVDWNNIFASEDALDVAYTPVHFFGNSYRLKVNNKIETANLVSSLSSYINIKESNYTFKTSWGEDYYLGNGITVLFNKEVAKSIVDSIISVNNLELIRHSPYMPELYFFEAPGKTKKEQLNIANEIYEGGFAESSLLGYIIRIILCSPPLPPNDYYYNLQYYLHPDTTDFEEAFEYTLTSDTIEIALLDSGLEPHEDLPAGKMKGRSYVYGYSSDYGLNDKCNDSMPASCYHGIAVAGLIAASTDNSIGMAGTCDQVNIRMQKISNEYRWANTIGLRLAFGAARDSGAAIISNSWIFNFDNTLGQTAEDVDPVLWGMIGNAVDSGIVVIWAAGNCDLPEPYLQCGEAMPFASGHPDVICVGATTKADYRWDYSFYDSTGYLVDVMAPGVDIFSLDQMGTDTGYHKGDIPSTNYISGTVLDGTSFAAPIVAGLAARIMARRPDFIGQPDSIKQVIYHSTGNGWSHPDSSQEDSHTKTYQMGYGRINAARAMLAISRGDVDNTTALNILDVLYIIAYKYEGGPPPTPNVLLGDADCSGHINILDAVYLINHISNGGPRPPLCYRF